MNRLWETHHRDWRDPAQIASQWREADAVEPELLRHRADARWWDLITALGITLLVTREYEHLVMAISAVDGCPQVTYLPLPHPSGLAVDRAAARVHIASTRNPNQVYELAPVTGLMERADIDVDAPEGRPMIPVRSQFLPGALYIHDLALIGGRLHANAVGENAVVALTSDGYERIWWPQAIETREGPVFGRNHLQLNSIAAGATVDTSFFSASSEALSSRRPGHRNYPVDGRGVVYAGDSREPMLRGLTRPHSARLNGGRVWVDNSGYGQLGFADDGRYEVVSRLPGWTRGLCFVGDVAFVGTSRVIPRFAQYAPGLNVADSRCGVHAVSLESGEILGTMTWPNGNQIFGLDWLPASTSTGFAFRVGRARSQTREKKLFYAFQTRTSGAHRG